MIDRGENADRNPTTSIVGLCRYRSSWCNTYVAYNKNVAILTARGKVAWKRMKYSEFIRWLRAQGVTFDRQRGSHLFVRFNGMTTVVPNHGAKEIPEPLRKKIIKDLGLK